MKFVKPIAIVGALGLALGGYAIVQKHHGAFHHSNSPAMRAHLSEVFQKFAAFDANKDGQFDAAEKQSLADAAKNGTLQFPDHMPDFGSEQARLDHVCEMYPRFAAYDADHDGILDPAEQTALGKAIENGELALPSSQPARTAKSLHAR